jgi:D-mannonate dehydratase
MADTAAQQRYKVLISRILPPIVVVVRAARRQLFRGTTIYRPDHGELRAGRTNQSKVGCSCIGRARRGGEIRDSVRLQERMRTRV